MITMPRFYNLLLFFDIPAPHPSKDGRQVRDDKDCKYIIFDPRRSIPAKDAGSKEHSALLIVIILKGFI